MSSEAAAAVAATFSSSAPETIGWRISKFVLCAHGTVLTELS